MDISSEINNFCRNIYLLRIFKNLSVGQMARILKIQPQTLELLEKGILSEEVTVEILFGIQNNFHIKPSQMFSDWNIPYH